MKCVIEACRWVNVQIRIRIESALLSSIDMHIESSFSRLISFVIFLYKWQPEMAVANDFILLHIIYHVEVVKFSLSIGVIAGAARLNYI